MKNKLGFIQGRLSPIIGGKIQAFPRVHWRDEFKIGAGAGWHLMEWTLDHADLSENPLLTVEGRCEIRQLCEEYHFSILSVTGDCFMQAPPHKQRQSMANSLMEDFDLVVRSCSEIGVKYIVYPLVDNGSLETDEQEECFVSLMNSRVGLLRDNNVEIVFESDYSPNELAAMIERLPADCFGINYDIGNSAALGYNYQEELSSYGGRVRNVHVKDRKLNGGTVALGEGAANFSGVFRSLEQIGYVGNYIMQTARASSGDHEGALNEYRKFVLRSMLVGV